jgi:HK97 family phage major capsid protein
MNNEEFTTELEEIRSNIEKAETVEEIDALNAKMDDLETRRKEALDAAKEAQEMRDAVASGEIETRTIETEVTQEETHMKTLEEVRSSAEYMEAFADYMRTGSDKECRALLTELVSGGSVPVPTETANQIATNWTKLGIASRCSILNVPGIVKIPVEASAEDALIHEEGAAAGKEEALVLSSITLVPQTIKKWITISDEALAMSAADLMKYIVDEITYRVLLYLDNKVVTTIKGEAGGLVADVEKSLGWDSIFAALAALGDDVVNPVAIMKRETFFNGFLSLADEQSRPIYDVVTTNGEPKYFINGVEVIFSSALDDASTADNVYAIVGDLSGFTINYVDGQNVKFITDPYSLAEKDLVKVVGSIKAGLGVSKAGAFARLVVASEG